MSGRIGITVFWILGPLVLVACVSLIILKLLKPGHDESSTPVPSRQSSGQQKKTSVSTADTCPDLERLAPDFSISVREAQSHKFDKAVIRSLAAA